MLSTIACQLQKQAAGDLIYAIQNASGTIKEEIPGRFPYFYRI